MRFKSVLKWLFTKIVHDALPAALASLLGGILLTHFQIGQAPHSTTVKVTPASAEMMQLLRDEHVAIVDFVKGQAAIDKTRGAPEPEAQQAAAEPAPASVPPATPVLPPSRPNTATAMATPKPAVRGKTPLAIAPAPAATPVAAADAAAQPAVRADDSLMAKTIGIKDRVISATQRAVSATVGFIPSWFGSVGDRIGGEGQSPRPPADLVSASWTLPGATDR
jgi:pyruvate/2-oxoglutarate dehydrogenase complex dihydrolipoamide acyltransferase (E2) component